jgi:hypothetical protein
MTLSKPLTLNKPLTPLINNFKSGIYKGGCLKCLPNPRVINGIEASSVTIQSQRALDVYDEYMMAQVNSATIILELLKEKINT